MIRRGGKEASERRSGIGEDERAAGDGAIGHSMEAFQFGKIGSA